MTEQQKELNKTGDIFWLDKWEGKAMSGAYTRCNLNENIIHFNKQFGKKVVGIKIDFEGGWNLEFILEEK